MLLHKGLKGEYEIKKTKRNTQQGGKNGKRARKPRAVLLQIRKEKQNHRLLDYRWAQTQPRGAFKARCQINPQNKHSHALRARAERPHAALSGCPTSLGRGAPCPKHKGGGWAARRGRAVTRQGTGGCQVVAEPSGAAGPLQHRRYSAADGRLSLSSLFSAPLSSSSISPSSPLNLS